MKARLVRPAAIGLMLSMAASGVALGASGSTQVAWPGKPTTAGPGWAKRAIEVVNDPVRLEGWNPWFTECPNDLSYYGLDVKTPADVDRLIRKLAEIKTRGVEVRLDPDRGGKHVQGAGAVFTIGDQTVLDDWYKRLPEVEPGIRRFGVSLYKKAPTALPPTLTLYVGHKAIDLNRLEIPPSLRVESGLSDAYRAEHPDDPTVKAIDAFLVKRDRDIPKGYLRHRGAK